MKQHLEESIELDEQEKLELGEESGNNVPETLINKRKIQKKVYKKS